MLCNSVTFNLNITAVPHRETFIKYVTHIKGGGVYVTDEPIRGGETRRWDKANQSGRLRVQGLKRRDHQLVGNIK